MENKIDIANLLKDYPKGMELYSPLCGECELYAVIQGIIHVNTKSNKLMTFYSNGRYMQDGECVLFPSKENRDWNTFQIPFKDGDIVFYNDTIAIFKEWGDETLFRTYVTKYLCYDSLIDTNVPLFGKSVRKEIRFATEEEKKKLFDAIKENGYKWNQETKTLEKLPKFKVGDRVKRISDNTLGKVVKVDDKGYYINYPKGNGVCYISFTCEKDYELTPNKFGITTLTPFESRVLVRNVGAWEPAFWGYYSEEYAYPFVVTGGNTFAQCIPYEGNEHLSGTTNDCDEYYKNW